MIDRANVLTIEARGVCLGPSADGEQFLVDFIKQIRPGDMCRVQIKRDGAFDAPYRHGFDRTDDDGPINVLKIFLARAHLGGRDVLLLGQVGPPCIIPLPIDEIESLFLIVKPTGPALCAREENREAWKLIEAFCDGAAIKPIPSSRVRALMSGRVPLLVEVQADNPGADAA